MKLQRQKVWLISLGIFAFLITISLSILKIASLSTKIVGYSGAVFFILLGVFNKFKQ